jgi:hypothetical protein
MIHGKDPEGSDWVGKVLGRSGRDGEKAITKEIVSPAADQTLRASDEGQVLGSLCECET